MVARETFNHGKAVELAVHAGYVTGEQSELLILTFTLIF